MNCKKCNSPITAFDKFCPNCGEANELFNNGESVNSEEKVEVIAETPVDQASTPISSQEQVPSPATEPVSEVPTSQVIENAMPNTQPTEPINQQTAPINGKKKGNGLFIAIVIILALIIVGLGVFIIIKLAGNTPSVDNGNSGSNENTQVEPSNNGSSSSNSNSNNTNPSTVNTSTTVDIGSGYSVTIPNGFSTKEIEGTTVIGNKDLVFDMFVNYYSYNTIKANASQLASTIESEVGTVKSHSEVTYGGRKYYIFKIEINGNSMDYYFTALDDYSNIQGELLIAGNITSEQAYSYVNQVVNSAKSSSSSFASGEEKLEIRKIELPKSME